MRIPRVFWGTERSVLDTLLPIIGGYIETLIWPEDAFSNLVDTKSPAPEFNDGVIVFYESPYISEQNHFRIYALSLAISQYELSDSKRAELQKSIFDALVAQPWGLMTLLSADMPIPGFSKDLDRAYRFFRQFDSVWDDLQAERHLYCQPENLDKNQSAFWNIPFTNLFFLMRQAGVPKSQFDNTSLPYPDGQIRGWINEYILDKHSSLARTRQAVG